MSIAIISLTFFFSSRRRHTRWNCDWSSDVCSSDLPRAAGCAHGEHPRVVGIEDHGTLRGNGANQRGFFLLNALERAEELRVRARHGGDGGDGRARDGGQDGDLARAIGAELEGSRAMLGRELEECEGKAP